MVRFCSALSLEKENILVCINCTIYFFFFAIVLTANSGLYRAVFFISFIVDKNK